MSNLSTIKIPLRLRQQLDFIVEIDKLKDILRKTKIFNGTRFENDAEHSWHLCMLALILVEYSNVKTIDVSKVIKMVLIHDLGEIEIGDIPVYEKVNHPKIAKREEQAIIRLFGKLPSDQQNEFIQLWKEFEDKITPEAKFAAAIDRIEPLLQNYISKGYSWKSLGATSAKVRQVNQHIKNGSEELWSFIDSLLQSSDIQGYFAVEKQ